MSARSSNSLIQGGRVNTTLSPAARELLGDMGYDPTYGARPLRRVIQKQLVDKLALALLAGEFHAGDTVAVQAQDGALVFEHTAEPAQVA